MEMTRAQAAAGRQGSRARRAAQAVRIGPDDDRPLCEITAGELHDFEPYDHEDGSVRNACADCGEPASPEIIIPAPGQGD